MNREDIIRMAQEAQMPFYWRTGEITYLDKLERFAALVASAERERIKQANAPEIERINAYIKEALAQPERSMKVEGPLHVVCQCNKCNTQPEQEPVGQLLEDAFGRGQVMWFNKPKDESMLYTTTPQRTWVGLTDEELQPIADEYRILFGSWVKDFAQAIETKLRSKNNG